METKNTSINYLSIQQIAPIIESYLLSKNPQIADEIDDMDENEKISILSSTPQWTYLQLIDQYLVCQLGEQQYSVMLRQQEVVGVSILPHRFTPGFLFVKKFFEYHLYQRQMEEKDIKALMQKASVMKIGDPNNALAYWKQLIRLIQEYELKEDNPNYQGTKDERSAIKEQLDDNEDLFEMYADARPELFGEVELQGDTGDINEEELSIINNLPFLRLLHLTKGTKRNHKISPTNIMFEAIYLIIIVVTIFLWPHDLKSPINIITLLIWVAILTQLFTLALTNAKYMLYPDRSIMLLAITVIAFQILIGGNLSSILLGGLVLGGVPYTIYIISKGTWIGLGDVKLNLTIGLLLGFNLSLLYLACLVVIYIIIALSILILANSLTMKRGARIPTGVLWVAPAVFCMLFGQMILDIFI